MSVQFLLIVWAVSFEVAWACGSILAARRYDGVPHMPGPHARVIDDGT